MSMQPTIQHYRLTLYEVGMVKETARIRTALYLSYFPSFVGEMAAFLHSKLLRHAPRKGGSSYAIFQNKDNENKDSKDKERDVTFDLRRHELHKIDHFTGESELIPDEILKKRGLLDIELTLRAAIAIQSTQSLDAMVHDHLRRFGGIPPSNFSPESKPRPILEYTFLPDSSLAKMREYYGLRNVMMDALAEMQLLRISLPAAPP